jgi:peptidoglycan hydrolase CwlO-like protein
MLKVPRIFQNIILLFSFLLYSTVLFNFPVYSNEIIELENEIAETEKELEEKESVLKSVESRIKEISNSNYSLSQKITLITDEINELEENIEKTEKDIEEKVLAINEKQEQLEKTKVLIDDVSGTLYVESRYKISNFFLGNNNWKKFVEGIMIKQSTISMLRSEVEKIGGEFSSLAESKADLDKQMEDLDSQKKGLDDAHALLASEKSRLQSELSKQVASKSGLSAEITDLNAKVSQLQAALIAARSAGFVSSGGYTGTEDGTSILQAPAGSFGVFSIGAYTHRNGMSQWGAKARDDAGQTFTQILSAYYPGTVIRTGTAVINGTSEPIMSDILVEGFGSMSFEDAYLHGIREINPAWNTTEDMNVLKAQVIAARTYAVRHTSNGRSSICTTQSCQVYSSTHYTGAWVQAINETKGQILTDGAGVPVSTQYAAVHGGWVNNVGWDTESGGGNNWFNDAWERKSGVTWFYKSWYREGTSSAGETCGHTPWFSQQEMVDLLNAYFIKNDIGLKSTPDKSRLLPSDFGKCPGRLDYGNTSKVPYTSVQLKSFLKSPVNSVTSVSTSLSNGSTSTVSFGTDRGTVSISGFAFKDIYNQMAPGHLRIQQQSTYAYFNVEKR